MKPGENYGIYLLGRYIEQVERYKLAVVIFFLLSCCAAVIYTRNNVRINTATKDMLSRELDWRKLDLQYEQHFPQFTNNILVVVESTTPDQAGDAAQKIYEELLKESTLFETVYYPRVLSTFRDDALLYLDTEELEDLADNLAMIQPFLSRLTEDLSLRGLFSMLSDAVNAADDGEDIDIEPLISGLDAAIEATLAGEHYHLSWQNLMYANADDPDGIYREFIILQPNLDYSGFFPASKAIGKIREISAESDVKNIGATVRLTGGVILGHEELQSVSRGTGTAILLSVCVVITIMVLGLRSVRLVIFTLITLFAGLVLTTAFATLTVGELNLISVAFAVLYIGLGVDYAIHYCLRYRELCIRGMNNKQAIEESSRNIGSSLFICTLTTVVGFYAFIPTDYRGVAELGWISGSGMFISFFITLTLLPALAGLMPLNPAKLHSRAVGYAVPRKISTIPITHSGKVKVAALLLAASCLWLIDDIRFDYNTLNLQDPDNESVRTYKDLLADTDISPWTGVIVTDNHEDALKTSERLEKLDVVSKVTWLEDFIPDDQEEKLYLIDNMNLLLPGGLHGPGSGNRPTTADQYLALEEFLARHQGSKFMQSSVPGTALLDHIKRLLDRTAAMSADDRKSVIDRLSVSVLASLPGRLQALEDSLDADRIELESLPDELKQRWRSPDGGYLLIIYPSENLNDNPAMRRFVKTLQEADPRVIGSPVVNIEASDAVVESFLEAFLYSFIAITSLLLLLLPHKRDTLFIIIPLAFAVICTGGVAVLFDMPFNFANIIALPLLLGMGVDSGIHILHRFRTALPDHNNILATSTARAVVVSAATTIGSIGNLAFSPHAGTASMGLLLATGIGITLISTLILLPALLAKQIPGEKNT